MEKAMTIVRIAPYFAAAILMAAPINTSFAEQKRAQSMEHVVQFEYMATDLDAMSKQELDNLSKWLSKNKRRQVIIKESMEATQTTTPTAANAPTGARADQIKSYLVEKGIPEERIVIASESTIIDKPARLLRVVIVTDRPGSRELYEARQLAEQNQKALEEVSSRLETVQTEVSRPQPMPTHTVIEEKTVVVTPAQTPGIGLTVGGGVTDFVDKDSRNLANVGGTWEARLAYGTRRVIGAEVGYVGSAANLRTSGVSDNARLLGTSVEGNLVFGSSFGKVRPYVFGGVGASRYKIVNTEFNDSNLKDQETAFYVPVGVGIGLRAMGVLFDIRGTMRPAFRDELQREVTGDQSARLSSWAATARLGWEF
jgi:hypothetical protein